MADKITDAATGDRGLRAAWVDQPRRGDFSGRHAFSKNPIKHLT